MNRLYNIIRKIVCVSLLCVIISDFGLAQNIKKVYKQITKHEIDDANNELKQFSTASLDNNELTLYDLANCLVLCNPLLTNNDPFKSNGMFEKIDFTKSNKSEVNDFLEKFDLSIDKIHDTIYTRILDYAKKQNTEASYTSALTVCTNCFYKGEVTKLQVNSAYNETIKKASISGYKEFISKYPNSEYRNEIQRLEETLAFSNAKTKNCLIGFKNYIEGYSSTSNQYLPLAINLRDSIVFFTLNQNYADFKAFIKENPKSIYSPLAQQALPKLLFTKALKEGSIDLYKRFLVEFPTDTRKDSVLLNLEKLEFEKLVAKPSIEEIELFKKNYPNTRFRQEVSELVAELSANDIKRLGLHGNIKSLVVNIYKSINISNQFDKGELMDKIDYLFNESGNLIEQNSKNKDRTLLYKYDGNRKPKEFKVFKFDGSLSSRDTFKYDGNGNKIEELNYNSDNKLSRRVITKYNEVGNKLEDLIYDINGNLTDRSTYDGNGNLTEQSLYNSDGILSRHKKYDKGHSIEESEFNSDGILRESKTSTYDEKGNLIDLSVNKAGIKYRFRNDYKYSENGNILEISEYKPDNSLSQRQTFKYDDKGNKIEYSSFGLNGIISGQETYDPRGNILNAYSYYSGKISNQTSYKYDDRGNMIDYEYLIPDKDYEGKIDRITKKLDGKGNTLDYSSYKNGNLVERIIDRYDENGNLIENSTYNSNSSLNKRYLFKYNQNNDLLEYSLFDSSGSLVKSEMNRYDEKGRILEFFDPREQVKINCQYSSKGIDVEITAPTYEGVITKAVIKYDNYNNILKIDHFDRSFSDLRTLKEVWFKGDFVMPNFINTGRCNEAKIEYYK